MQPNHNETGGFDDFNNVYSPMIFTKIHFQIRY